MPTWCKNVIYWSFLSSTCFGCIRPSSGAPDVKLQHLTRDLRSGSQDHHPSTDWVLQLNIWCSWWWAYVPETCRAKETSINYIVPSSWHFTLFHDEDARSNNPQKIFWLQFLDDTMHIGKGFLAFQRNLYPPSSAVYPRHRGRSFC